MAKEEAIKYLQQLYPNGGHCWLDEQRIEAIGMAIQALQEEPTSDTQSLAMFYGMTGSVDNTKEEPVSEDLKEFEVEYIEREKDNIICVYDRHAGLVDGAKWQKEQMMKEAFDGEVGYWNLRGLSVNVELPHSVEEGDKVKVIVIKEE